MKRAIVCVATATAFVTLAGCGAVPHDRSASIAVKRASTTAQAATVLARFAAVRANAAKTADYGHLGDVESGTLLSIEATAYYASRALGVTPGAAAVGLPTVVWSGSFTTYPMWFATVAPSDGEKTQVALALTRRSSTDPWRAVMAPRLAIDTALPDIETNDGTASTIAGDQAVAHSVSATTLARRYANVLADPNSRYADEFEQDSFISQMRQLVAAQPREHIVFRQTWTADPVKYAFRLADGGILMFIDLHRDDYYQIKGKHALGFTGSQAAAFIPEPIHHDARLSYEHEVLLLAPADGKPLAIGQYGGLVDASGH